MASAFILITCDVGKEELIINQLEKLNYITDIRIVHGAYDLIAKVEGKSPNQVREIISNKIRAMTSVRSAMSLPLRFYN